MSNGTDLSVNRSSPVADYISLDFDGLKASFESYAQRKFADRWTDFNESQFAVVLLELLAYLGDVVGYQINAHVRELYPATVRRRQNLINYSKGFDYEVQPADSATTVLTITLDAGGSYPFTIIAATTQFSNGDSEGDEVFFQPDNDLVVPAYTATMSIACTEGQKYNNNLIGVSTAAANQRWQFPQDSVVVSSVSVTVGGVLWTRVSNFTKYTSIDKVYKVIYNDAGNVFLLFGDGTYGIVPSNGAQIRSTYSTGGGRRGNLAKETVTTIVSSHVNIVGVTNNDKTSGGVDAQSMKSARNALPDSLATLSRGVATDDYAKLAATVAGVARARSRSGSPPGARIIKLIVAPSGGGQPTPVLKTAIINFFRGKKMATNRVRVFGPTYKSIRLTVLLHVNPSYRAPLVNVLTRKALINSNGAGFLNFEQLDFAAIDSNGELPISQARLQELFKSLSIIGLDRAEIQRLDVIPQARAREEGNIGDGGISAASIILDGTQKRREFFAVVTSTSTYDVYERIVGFISSLTDTVLTDDVKDFSSEGLLTTLYKLVPYRGMAATVDVLSAVGQELEIVANSSLFAMTEPGAEYYMYSATPRHLTIGSEFTSADGSVRFTLENGGTPFVAGDSFSIDVFPAVSDIRLRDDEYPELEEANLNTRTSGGAKV